MGAPYPSVIPEAFALNADPSRRNVIPATTVSTQRASWNIGFPPLTMTPVVAGGKPMLGPDMNGVLYMLSSHDFYQQSGQPYRWNADVVVATGGYAAGTLLGSTDGQTLWLSVINNNVSDPDAAGAGWVPMFAYGVTVLAPSTGGVVTLTQTQASKGVIVISGALVANLQVNIPNAFIPAMGATTGARRWLIVNTCTGGFTVTVKTTSGAGVAIPAGGFAAPTEVYSDGTNVYNVVAPITLPTDVAPTANTIVLRSNNGYVYATYLNQNSPLENFTINEVFAGIGDGFLRKIGRLNFAENFLLSWFAGQVADGQVPVTAVNQWRGTILDNSNLTGVPTAPTAAPGTNTGQVASTAFVQTAIGAQTVFSGQVNAGGGGSEPAGWTFTRLGLGQYRITHNQGVVLKVAATLISAAPLQDIIVTWPVDGNNFDCYVSFAGNNSFRDRDFSFLASR